MNNENPTLHENKRSLGEIKLYRIQEHTARSVLRSIKIPIGLSLVILFLQLLQFFTGSVDKTKLASGNLIIVLFLLIPFCLGYFLLNSSYKKNVSALLQVLESIPEEDILALEERCLGRVLPNVIIQGDYLYVNRVMGTSALLLRDIIWLYCYRDSIVGIINIPAVKITTRDKKSVSAKFTTEDVNEFLQTIHQMNSHIYISTTGKEKRQHKKLFKENLRQMVDTVDQGTDRS